MENILQKIVAGVRRDLTAAKRLIPEIQLREIISALPERPRFAAAFSGGDGAPPRVVAELKKASPSRGMIREDFDVRALAGELETAGATAISVLTEKHHFLGSLENLKLAAEATSLPLLRKDFIFDSYQLLEAKADGASAVLLIAALFPDTSRLLELMLQAHELGLDVLGEAHDEAEIEILAGAGTDCIGINARDLRTFCTDLGRVERLLRLVPEECVAIAESAITVSGDIERLAAAGANGFLIGETLMRARCPGEALRRLIGEKP